MTTNQSHAQTNPTPNGPPMYLVDSHLPSDRRPGSTAGALLQGAGAHPRLIDRAARWPARSPRRGRAGRPSTR